MNMSNDIKHTGVVESIETDCMHVRIVQAAACAGCKAAQICNASESKEKIIDVYDKHSIRSHVVGESVVVIASKRTGMRAVMIGFVAPFVILVFTLFVVSQFTGNELTAAVSGLVALVPYYAIVYILKDRLREEFSFVVED